MLDFTGYPHLEQRYMRRKMAILANPAGCSNGCSALRKLDAEYYDILRRSRERDKKRRRR